MAKTQTISPGFRFVHGLLKTSAIVAGLTISMLALAALVGTFTGNLIAQFGIAAAANFIVPLVIVDRVLPDDPSHGRGLTTDVLAVFWLGLAVLSVGLAHGVLRPALLREGQRLRAAHAPAVARGVYWLAGARPVETLVGPIRPLQHVLEPATSDAGVPIATAPTDAGAVVADGPADSGSERTPAELFRLLAPTVVSISVRTEQGEGGGTGFFVDTQGTLATNHHVIADARDVRIKLRDGTQIGDVELLADDAEVDLALLQVHTPTPNAVAHLGDSDHIEVGERAISIGNPLGLEYTLTDGLVSARRMWEGRQMIQMSVPVSPGNSGGPLFEMHGDVIGITTAQVGAFSFGRAQNLNLAVPVNVLRRLIQPSYPHRRHIGSGSSSSTW